ncbi:hypothetical protein E5D57_010933 [Metarhizium anisopliae]|nr:hypothetical protein E5D57_010933 [Metarhizium anisopliae]
MGQLLANCLGRMVEKGLLVTVVLDCCFSGSVLRDGNIRGTDVRAVDYNSDVDAGIPSGTSSDFFQRDQLFRDAAVPRSVARCTRRLHDPCGMRPP